MYICNTAEQGPPIYKEIGCYHIFFIVSELYGFSRNGPSPWLAVKLLINN